MPALLDILTGWPLFLSLALAIGAAAARWLVLPRAVHTFPELRGAPTVVVRVGGRAAWVLVAALCLVLLRQLREFHDPFETWSADARLLLAGTRWGTTWWLALGAALTAVVGFRLARAERRAGWWLATLAVLASGAFPGLMGHANSGDLRGLTLAADALHVWAMGGWIGTLAVVLVLEARQRRLGRAEGPGLLPLLVPRFNPVAITSVSTLAVTGIVAASVHLGSLGALLGTTYGRLLTLKVALVLGVLALGALNWRRLTPRLGEQDGQAAMRKAATMELVVANLVLAVTSILVRTSTM